MAITLLLHIVNEDPIQCEVDRLPEPTDLIVIARNPRRRDGKDLNNILPDVNTVIWPMSRINFIEVMPTAEEEKVVSFVRE